MSTGLNCEFANSPEGKWYYILQQGSYPKQCWDWYEYADCFGPFDSEQEADDHLARHHANPGGSFTIDQKDFAKRMKNETFRKLIEGARLNKLERY